MSTNRILRRAAAAVVGLVALVASPAAVSAAPASMTYECFGYTGTFMAGTKIIKADWNSDGNPDECFGVAPNRHIYHSWPGRSWVEMPNNGRADDMGGYGIDYLGHRFVMVWVASEQRIWISTLIGTWGPWEPGTD